MRYWMSDQVLVDKQYLEDLEMQVAISPTNGYFNGHTFAELERLVCLAEECAEVIQASCKAIRHGMDSRHPDRNTNNRDELAMEVGNASYLMNRMVDEGDIAEGIVDRGWDAKEINFDKYTHHQEVENG